MAFPTTRQDHVHDSVKSILYSDPYANEPDTLSASKMLKERRKQEARELYYKTLPIKEKRDVARGVLTNVYHQQLDIPSRAPASVVPHVIASSFSSQRVDPNAPPPTPPDAPPKQTLVTNLVGGKYYGNRGPLLRDLGVPTRSLGHRRDQLGFSGGASSLNGESAVPSSSARLRSASASEALGQGFAADGGRSSWGQRSNSQMVVKGSLRTTPDMVTANMQYGSHTRKGLSSDAGAGGGVSNFDDDEFMANDPPYSAHKKPHEGEPFYPQHSRKPHDDVDFARSNNNTTNETYDEVSYCTNADIFPNRTEPAPWDKDSAYHSAAQHQRANETAGNGKVQIVPKSDHGRFGQERQNFIAPAAAIGTTDPAKLQRFALGQPNRSAAGGPSPALASANEKHQARSSANIALPSREAGIGTHSNDFNGRRPDPASDLVNCETGLSVHHRGVGVTEAAFRPEYISHEGAHDKTVQRGGWMLAGRDANRTYASGVADHEVARAAGTVGGVSTRPTQTDGRKDELPSKEEMQRGFNVLPEEDPRGGLGGFNNIPKHQLDSQQGVTDGAESVYPPPHAQQQHYFDAAAAGGSAPPAIGSPANTSTNPEYWHRLRESFAKGPSDPYAQAVISAVKRGDPIPGGASSAASQATRSRSVGQLPHHHHGRPIATGAGVSVPQRVTLQRMKGDGARNASLGVVPSSTLVRESKNSLDGGGGAVAVGTRGLSGATDAEVRRFETQRSSSANPTLSRNSRFGNRPQDTMLRLF